MAIGLSGFELTLTAAPLVAASPGDSPKHPRGRIFRSRLMILTAAVVMCVLVLGSTFVVTLLVPDGALRTATGEVQHRSLSYLAHGELLSDDHRGEDVITLFGSTFGTIYDLSTVFILCLAGASATVSLKDMVPEFLSRFGMQLDLGAPARRHHAPVQRRRPARDHRLPGERVGPARRVRRRRPRRCCSGRRWRRRWTSASAGRASSAGSGSCRSSWRRSCSRSWAC